MTGVVARSPKSACSIAQVRWAGGNPVSNATSTDLSLLEIDSLKKYFPVTRGGLLRRRVGDVKAVDDVSFSVERGETVGLVGESGCGKTTIGRCVLRLETPTEGQIRFDGDDVHALDHESVRQFRRRVQAVFQDPYGSLNPRMRVREIVAEPLIIHRISSDAATTAQRVREMLNLCGLPQGLGDRYPHEMSGGQRQRVGIARALALNPDFVICDEAVSALDVSIQAQIINLLEDLRDELGLTYLFIGHDLSVVKHLCHRIAVMYLGKVVEVGESDELFDNPKHPYTRALLAAIPLPDPIVEAERPHETLRGEVPSPLDPPTGCVFHPRCPVAVDECRSRKPKLQDLGAGHYVACPEVLPG